MPFAASWTRSTRRLTMTDLSRRSLLRGASAATLAAAMPASLATVSPAASLPVLDPTGSVCSARAISALMSGGRALLRGEVVGPDSWGVVSVPQGDYLIDEPISANPTGSEVKLARLCGSNISASERFSGEFMVRILNSSVSGDTEESRTIIEVSCCSFDMSRAVSLLDSGFMCDGLSLRSYGVDF